ncbi:uncharacterized protein LOC131621641 [Vicia villosa]|uniref:uncharacterized protein LOC131621641 n=1 Tax=Vicia villosa TaxID=3911 RepID=UPI00273B5E0D|nr:uncharacterized protein LOC131621641 [Vicia villosa]
MNGVKKLNSESTELPDCVISYIFSKLSLKNLVKTSALSKQWYHEWGLRKDLTFNLHNMFDYNTLPELPITRPLFQQLQSQFATRLDYFMQKYPGDMISSIRVKFPLGVDHTYAIDGLIHKGVLKGANRIELLFSYKTDLKIQPYKFLFPFLSGTNSVTYLHLQNCHIATSMKFSGLKNLKTLVLTLVPVEKNMLRHLCFNCIHLENFTLNQCIFLSDLRIRSTTLLHLNIDCGRTITKATMARKIDIIASNLLSIEYSSKCIFPHRLHKLNINSHTLSQFNYRCCQISNLVKFSRLKNVTTIVLDGLFEHIRSDVVTHLFSKCLQLEEVTFKKCRLSCELKIISAKLRHLNIIDCRGREHDSFKIDIDALNLSSFEYRGYTSPIISVEAPKLLKVFWDGGFNKIDVYNFGTIAKLHHIENLTINSYLSLIFRFTKEYLGQYRNLIQLKLFIDGEYYPNKDYFGILDIAMASPHLQKLSLTIKNRHTKISHMVESHRQRREYVRFFHNGLKYVELHGCVCSIKVIELASHLLRSATLLRQITFSSRHNYYIGAGAWTNNGSNGCCWFERNLIHEHLKDEVNEQCRLVIL